MSALAILSADLPHLNWDAPGRQLYAIDFGSGQPSPLAVVNGVEAGPTLLLIGGVHGDEYDGPAVLTEVIRTIDPAALRGRLIVMPVANPTGLERRQRHVGDGRDLNRSFPGRHDGALSERIADVIDRILIPRADIVYDIHAGGVDNAILPSVIFNRRATVAEADAAVDSALAFAAPYAIVMEQNGHATMLDYAAERQGKVFGCVEMGSFGSITPTTLRITRTGVENILVHAGLVRSSPPAAAAGQLPATRALAAMHADCHLVAPADGLFVPALHLGDAIAAGGTIGELIDVHAPLQPPMPLVCARGGEVYVVHSGGPVRRGDLIATIAQPVSEAELRRLARPIPQG